MKFFVRGIFLFSLFTGVLHAQDFIGYGTSNYSGVNGIDMQPASIADSRYKLDVNVFGGSLFMGNNYAGLLSEVFKEKGAFKDSLFRDNYFNIKDNERTKSAFLRNNIILPSVMFTHSAKTAMAFTYRVRNYVNVDGIDNDLAELIFRRFNQPLLFNKNLKNEHLSAQFMSWSEYGFTYAHVLKDSAEHFFKWGGRIKLLQGISAAYVDMNNMRYRMGGKDSLGVLQADINYGHSSNANKDGIGYKFASLPGLGFDIGLVYEWRPNWKKYVFEMDGDSLRRKDRNKYKLKIGISVLDIGGIRYKTGAVSYNFTADVNAWSVGKLYNYKNLDDTLKNRFTTTQTNKSFNMNLPTALTAQVDYNLYGNFYLNFSPYIAFQLRNNDNKIHELTSLCITPRLDAKWFGVFLPLSYNKISGLNFGLSARLGPVVFGTTDFLPLVTPKSFYATDFYIAFKIPILYNRIRDMDRDHVSNAKDKCPNMAGTWEFEGCPDCDKDHIPDERDKCPDAYGTPDMEGCPDTDGDKVIDYRDSCPTVPGVPEMFGCPDKDGDKIVDFRDSCPDVAGVPQFMGCPDTDADGIEDSIDLCPEQQGKLEHSGCPDSDYDGIFDGDDHCPLVRGTPEFNGCPYPDKDKDGVFDKDDLCPETPGLIEAAGCPELQKEEEDVVNTAFADLQFEAGNDVIKEESIGSLEELAKLLNKNKTWELKIAGHTDNDGDAAKNMALSRQRTLAVKKLLTNKGVQPERIITEWFGQSKPIASNDTPEGRQQNRRVEMKIIFK